MTGYPRIDRISIILEEGYTLDRVILPADAKYLSKLDSLIAICRKQQIIVSIVKAKDFSNLSIENPQELYYFLVASRKFSLTNSSRNFDVQLTFIQRYYHLIAASISTKY